MPRTTLLRKQVTPTGTISSHAGGTAPEGHLICDGSIVSIADYPKLYNAIGTSWGYGNNDGLTFHLPDLRGRFLRGKDAGAGRDPNVGARTAANAGGATGDNVGSVQDDAAQSHWHTYHSIPNFNAGGSAAYARVPRQTGVNADLATPTVTNSSNSPIRNLTSDGSNGTPRTSSESRSKNANVNYIIKL